MMHFKLNRTPDHGTVLVRTDQYSIVMTRGKKEPYEVKEEKFDDAEYRVKHLCARVGVERNEVVYDPQTKTFVINADHYYAGVE